MGEEEGGAKGEGGEEGEVEEGKGLTRRSEAVVEAEVATGVV